MPPGETDGGLSHRIEPEKRQVTVGIIVTDRVPGVLERRIRWSQISIQILQSQYLGIVETVGQVPHVFNADFCDVLYTRN